VEATCEGRDVPDEAKGSHAYRLQVGVPVGGKVSVWREGSEGYKPHLLVISNVVPKIWARTNSAMVEGVVVSRATGAGRSGG
jgi:hypothetical protein